MTYGEAQQVHEDRQDADPEHDDCGCVCCCVDCDDDYRKVRDGCPNEGRPS